LFSSLHVIRSAVRAFENAAARSGELLDRARTGGVCRRPVLARVVVLLVLASGIAAGAGSGLPPQSAADEDLAPQPAAAADIEYDTTLLRIDLRADGDAAWTIEYRVTLDDQNATDAFESLREDVRANRSAFESQFADRMNRTARVAANATGREMVIRNVSVATRTETTAGVVSYTLTWTNFATASGDELRAGDAISGIVLDPGTTLFVGWPEAYGAVDVTPDPDERRAGVAIWNPPETFATDEPRLVLERGAGTKPPGDGGTPTDDGSPGTETTTSPAGVSGVDPLLLGVGAVILLALAAAAWYLRRRDRGAGIGATGDGDPGDDTGGPASDDPTTSAGGDGEPSGEAGAGTATGPPEELLSNEERVLRLLEDSGGRMKQQQVVQELDWTDAKTSQVVGRLRDDGEIEVFRIGRENVLALPGETDF
jgi:hypothetical protein